MKLTDLITSSSILPELKATTKSEVLRELAEGLCANHPQIDPGELVRILLEREKLGSTGLEEGIAIPHGKLKATEDVAAVFGRSTNGIDFDSIDQKPSKLFFLLVAPENSSGLHLKALARIVRATKEPVFRKALTEAPDTEKLEQIFQEEDKRQTTGQA